MKAVLTLIALAAVPALAACVPATPPPPTGTAAPAPRAQTQPRPAPAPAAPLPAAVDGRWMDAPLTPGGWRYSLGANGPVAVFAGSGGRGEFLMTCERPAGRISLWRAGRSGVARAMTIRTETATRSLGAVQAEDTNPYLAAALPSADPLLDAMALSKGRFAVEVEGQPPLFLPSHAEVSRVIEDCR